MAAASARGDVLGEVERWVVTGADVVGRVGGTVVGSLVEGAVGCLPPLVDAVGPRVVVDSGGPDGGGCCSADELVD